MKTGQRFSFSFGIKYWQLLFFCVVALNAVAQEKKIEGIVFDKDTKERIARTNIINITTGQQFYNNLQGEFKVNARVGDRLIFNKQDYLPDTVLVKNTDNIAVYLIRTAIPLPEVTIRDSLHTPLQKLMATKREYNKAYGPSSYNNFLSTAPGGGAGISIDALYNSLSRSGRNAEHLQGLIQKDYEQNVIDYRFSKSYVGNITKLKEPELSEFMIRYRPSYYLVSTDTEYEFINYIRNSLRRYLRNKRMFALPPLKPPQS